MPQDTFESLVKRLEPLAAADPEAHRRRLGLLAVCGWACGIAPGLLLCALSVALLVMLARLAHALPLLHSAAVVGLWLAPVGALLCLTLVARPARRPGIPLGSKDFPQLHALIERLRGSLPPLQLDAVLLTGDFNAAIVQSRGLTRRRHQLLIGMPLLQALTARELEAVIAHELGHVAGAGGGPAAWVCRLPKRWTTLHAESGPGRTGQLARFWEWYAPLLSAYTLVQARQQEYEADRASVRAVGAQVTASALLRVSLQGEFVAERFWPGVFRRADREPTPTLAPYARLATALRNQGPSLEQHCRLQRALQQPTGHRDTHPALIDRLRMIGVQPFLPEPVSVSAADELLGRAAADVQHALDEEWRRNVGVWWRERHRYASEARLRLMALARRARNLRLPEPELWERARLSEDLGARDDALALYGELLRRNSLHAGALWRRAQLMGERRDQYAK